MKLYLIQHGEATQEEVDPARPLTVQGKRDVQRVASFLKSAGIGPLTIRHSGKTRAKQTAEIVASRLGPECQIMESKNLSPNDPIRMVAEEISRMTGDLMIVGHLPFLGKLTSFLLTGSESKNVIAFRMGGVACLQRKDDRTWQVAWMMIPQLLPGEPQE